MPYRFEANHSDCPAGQGALINEETGEKVGCHPNEESANRQIAAIEANKQPGQMQATNVVGPQGSVLKDLDDKGTFGGHLVLFGGPKAHDLERDFYTKETDFWLKDGEGQSATLWTHGTDPELGKNRIDKGWAKIAVKDGGVWMETQLQKRNEYEEAIHRLAEKGKLGLSSGTASHLVEREPTKEGPDGVTHIKQWPLGLDGSLTPTPAEPRTGVKPLKSLSFPSIKELKSGGMGIDGRASNVQRVVAQMKAISMDERKRLIRQDFRSQFAEMRGVSSPNGIFDSFVIVRGERGEMYRVGYEGSPEQGYTFEDRGMWTEVVTNNQFMTREMDGETRSAKQTALGDRIANAREMMEMTQDELAMGTPITGSTISGIENGEIERPPDEVLRAIADNLDGVSFDQLQSLAMKYVAEELKTINQQFFGRSGSKAAPETKAEHSYSEGDLVAWEGGDAQGVIRRQVGPDESVTPTSTDRSFSGEEDDPGYLIELVDYDEEEGEVVGREETVFHLEGSLSKISKSDVKGVFGQIKSINEKFFGPSNGPDPTGTGDEVSSTLESLVQLTNSP